MFEIQKLPVYMLGSFGHAGIDWTHSLLDNHKQILLMPAFSFFRTLHKIEKINGISLNKLQNSKYASELLSDMFYSDISYQLKRRKFIFNTSQKEIFKNEVFKYLENTDDNIIKNLFFSIHYAFSKVHNINFSEKKCIVVHEHVSWHYKKYLDFFDANFIVIFRDPKAVLGGGILRMKNSNISKKLTSFQLDTMILDMICAYKIFLEKKKINNKIFVLQNEKMHINLREEMTKLSSWMKIDFYNTMLDQTFMGQIWLGESSYLAKDELEKKPPENFYNPNEVEKRWRSVLSKQDVNNIEVVFKNYIEDFNYNFDNKINFIKRILGYINFIFSYQYQEKYFLNKYLIILRNVLRRALILIFKEKVANFFKFK